MANLSLMAVGLLALASLYVFAVNSGDEVKPAQILEHFLLLITVGVGVALFERAFLWREIVEINKRLVNTAVEETTSLLRHARGAGISDVFESRGTAVDEIRRVMRSVEASNKSRIWIMAVSGTQDLELDKHQAELKRYAEAGVDVRLLLLDPLRSPAIFRAFLERERQNLEQIIGASGGKPNINMLFDLPMFRDSYRTFSALSSNGWDPRNVRFYAHAPVEWLVFINDVVYAQSYVFATRHPASSVLAANLMPVLKFKRAVTREPGYGQVDRFDLLEEHFKNVWETTDVDLFHMRARHDERVAIVSEIFERRKPWLNQCQWGLDSLNRRPNRREYPRQLVTWADQELTLCWRDQEGAQCRSRVVLRDTSGGGICVEVKSDGMVPPEHEVVSLEALDGCRASVQSILERLSARCRGNFRTVRNGAARARLVRLCAPLAA